MADIGADGKRRHCRSAGKPGAGRFRDLPAEEMPVLIAPFVRLSCDVEHRDAAAIL
jgi:hypothetical protein